MPTITFPYDHSRDPMSPGQLADQIANQFGLASNPSVDINPTQILVTHPQASESQRAAVQALIDAYVFDPVWAGGVEGVLRSRAQAALATNATFLAKASPTAAEVTAEVKALARQMDGVIRLALGLLDTTMGT